MAYGRKTGGRDIKKGMVLNPRGGQAHNADVRRIRKLTASEIAEVMTLILDHNLEKLSALVKDPESSVLKVWIARIAIESLKKGDAYQLNVLLDRVIGKAKEKIELTGAEGGPVKFEQLTPEEIDERTQRILSRIQARKVGK